MAWQKGQSGNYAGPKPDKPFLEALNRAIKQEDGKRLRAAAEKLLDAASNGEAWAIAMLSDRTDGKPTQQSDVKLDATVSLATVLAGLSTSDD